MEDRAILQVVSLHPEAILLAECLPVFCVDPFALFFGKQGHHLGKKRRLRPGNVISAVPIWDMPYPVDQVGEIIEHVFNQAKLPAFCQAKHGKIAVPIIDLPETSPGHDIGLGQGDKGTVAGKAV